MPDFEPGSAAATAAANTPTFSPQAVLDAPASFSADRNASFDEVDLAWDAVAGASHYEILRAANYRGQMSVVDTITGTTYNDSGLDATVNYAYSVRAINSTQSLTGIRTPVSYCPAQYETYA